MSQPQTDLGCSWRCADVQAERARELPVHHTQLLLSFSPKAALLLGLQKHAIAPQSTTTVKHSATIGTTPCRARSRFLWQILRSFLLSFLRSSAPPLAWGRKAGAREMSMTHIVVMRNAHCHVLSTSERPGLCAGREVDNFAHQQADDWPMLSIESFSVPPRTSNALSACSCLPPDICMSIHETHHKQVQLENDSAWLVTTLHACCCRHARVFTCMLGVPHEYVCILV